MLVGLRECDSRIGELYGEDLLNFDAEFEGDLPPHDGAFPSGDFGD